MLADRFDVFLFDLDGVIYIRDVVLPHVRESLVRLRKENKRVRFLTNDPRPTRAQAARKLDALGIEAYEEEVITSGWAVAEYLSSSGVRSTYVVGSRGLASEIGKLGVRTELDDPRDACEAVVVGGDEYVCYAHIKHAARLVREGSEFVATNPDGSFPTPEGLSPAAGAFVAAVEAAADKRPDVTVGKPHPPMFEAALAGLEVEKDRIVMVGDNPATDILGAHRAGITGILVSDEAPAFPTKRDFRIPDTVIPDLSSLFDPEVPLHRWKKPSFPWPERVAAGVAAVVFDNFGRILLGKRADNGLWGLPSGRVEVAETVEEAAKREVKEETGLEVEIGRLIGVYSDPESQAFAYPKDEVIQFVTSLFACVVIGGSLEADGIETLEVEFFEPDRLPPRLLPMHPAWLADALSYEEYSVFR